MVTATLRRSCVMALVALSIAALGACAATPASDGQVAASGTPGAAAPGSEGQLTASGTPQPRWSEDKMIQPNQLLPNGLRPLRYFYW